MRPAIIFVLLSCIVTLTHVTAAPNPQEQPAFEIPVQLLGFPVIIAAVRITNFVKKLAYSLNPQTYMSRPKRSYELLPGEPILSASEVEKKLVSEMGNNVCIFERVCSSYAQKAAQRKSRHSEMDWTDILSGYKSSTDTMKENYLLSVFLGDIIGSPQLCRQLVKRGRGCDDIMATD